MVKPFAGNRGNKKHSRRDENPMIAANGDQRCDHHQGYQPGLNKVPVGKILDKWGHREEQNQCEQKLHGGNLATFQVSKASHLFPFALASPFSAITFVRASSRGRDP